MYRSVFACVVGCDPVLAWDPVGRMAQEARAGWQAARRDAVSRSGLGSRREDVGVMAQEAKAEDRELIAHNVPGFAVNRSQR